MHHATLAACAWAIAVLVTVAACSSFEGESPKPLATVEAGTPEAGADAGESTCNGCPLVLLATNVPNIYTLVVDDTFVYAGSYARPGSVFRVPKVANSTPTLLVENTDYAVDLALHGDRLYYVTQTGTFVVPKAGGVAPQVIDATAATALAVDDANIYTCLYELFVGHEVMRIPIGGGLATPISKGANGCEMIALDGASIVYGDADSLQRIGPSGGDEEVRHYATRRAVISGSEIFSVNFGDPQVRRSSLDPAGQFQTIATNPNDEPTQFGAIAVDAKHVYWTIGSANGKVLRVPRAGGPIETIADGMKAPAGIALDDHSIYWSERDSGKLWMRQK